MRGKSAYGENMADKKISTELSVSVKGRDAVAGLTDDIDKIGDAAQQSSTDVEALNAAETAAEASARELSAASAAAGAALDKLGTGTDTVAAAVAELGRSAQQTRGSVQQLAAAESEAGDDARALGASTQAASKGVQDVGRAAGIWKQLAQSSRRSCRRLRPRAMRLQPPVQATPCAKSRPSNSPWWRAPSGPKLLLCSRRPMPGAKSLLPSAR